jgi:hypothetical protein
MKYTQANKYNGIVPLFFLDNINSGMQQSRYCVLGESNSKAAKLAVKSALIQEFPMSYGIA